MLTRNQLSAIPTPQDNPTIIVLPFQAETCDESLPATGTVIAEFFSHFLWRSTALNMQHSWLCWPRMRIPLARRTSPEVYVKSLSAELESGLYLTGSYRTVNGTLTITASLYSPNAEDSGNLNCLATATVRGPRAGIRALSEQAAACILDGWFPLAIENMASTSLIDANEETVTLVSCGYDCLSFRTHDDGLAGIYFARAIESDPNSGYAQFAAFAAVEGRWTIERCQQVLKMNPDYTPAFFPAVLAEDLHHDDQVAAWEMYSAGLERVPFNTEGYLGARDFAIALGFDTEVMRMCHLHSARGTFRSSVSEFGDTFLSAAEDASNAGRDGLAKSLCRAGLALAEDANSRAGLLARLAQIASDEACLEESIALYRLALELHDFAPWRASLAVELSRSGIMEEAITEFRRVVEDPLNSDRGTRNFARLRLGEMLEQTGQLQQALATYYQIEGRDEMDLESYQALTEAHERIDKLLHTNRE